MIAERTQKGAGKTWVIDLKPGDSTEISYQEGDSLDITIDVSGFRTADGATNLADAAFKTSEDDVIEDRSTHWNSQCTVITNLATTVRLVIESLTQAANGKKIIAVLQLHGAADQTGPDINVTVELKMGKKGSGFRVPCSYWLCVVFTALATGMALIP
ncbi:uncharacterized protein [Oscarella lobularis]|uniref:uncharacterized protein isoform X2 n=1 Tax=Oscarella lobularis TaxID=121494 RepID=UPI0033139984